MEENNVPNSPINSPNNAQKKFVFIGIAGVVILLILFLVFKNKESNDAEVDIFLPDIQGEEIVSSTPTSTATSSSPKAVPVVPKGTTAAPLSATQKYLDALRVYKNSGYYFQFVECHGLPGSLTMKKGKKFMLDNRDAKTRKIAIVGGQSFKITSYNFAIATAPSKPGTYYITCDGGGAAKIVVQQ